MIEPATLNGQTQRRDVGLLALAAVALFLPGFVTLPPMDRDEPRFAQATKQMLETGDFVAIRFQDEARNKKPVGVYWLQAAPVALADALGLPDARRTIALYRLPSLLGAVAAVLLTYWAGLALMSRRAAFAGALLFASTILIGVEARLAKTDAVIAATVALAMGALARVWMARDRGDWNRRRWGPPLLFWGAIGVGVLVKGPITPMIPAFAAAALAFKAGATRWLLALRPLPGIVLAIAIVVPWLALIMVATHGAFLADSVGADMLGKVAGAKEAHGAPPGAYIAAFPLAAWPLAPFAILAAPFAWASRREPATAFLLAWIAPAWLLFEAVPTKLPHYVLPLYPAIALLAGLALERGAGSLDQRWRRGVAWLLPGVAALLLLAGVGAAVALRAWPASAFFIAAPLVAWRVYRVSQAILTRRVDDLAPEAALLSGLVAVMVYGGVLSGPMFASFALSPRLAAAKAEISARAPNCPALQGAAAGYHEPSLVFLTDTDLLLTDGPGAGAFLAAGACRVAFVSSRDAEAFHAALGHPADLIRGEDVAGVNLNGGRRLDMQVWLRQ